MTQDAVIIMGKHNSFRLPLGYFNLHPDMIAFEFHGVDLGVARRLLAEQGEVHALRVGDSDYVATLTDISHDEVLSFGERKLVRALALIYRQSRTIKPEGAIA